MDSSAGGMMAARIKFDRERLEQQISPPDVVLANDQSCSLVISGTPGAVKQLSQVKARAIPLNASGAFHSLMAVAAAQFQVVLESVRFNSVWCQCCLM